MKLLLDTHLLLWAAGQPERLSASARKLLSDPRHELLSSAASLWEIAIKNTLGREDFRVEPRLLLRLPCSPSRTGAVSRAGALPGG